MTVDASLARDLAPTEQSVDEGFVSITRNKCSFLFQFFIFGLGFVTISNNAKYYSVPVVTLRESIL